MTTPNAPRCTVVIPTHARATSLRDALHALRVQTFRDFGVIVVVDGEDAATRALSEQLEVEFPLRWIFQLTSRGAGHARNAGVQAAESPFVAFLDDDTVPVPQWLERHMLAHAGDGEWTRIVRGKTWHSFTPPTSTIEKFLRGERMRIEQSFGSRTDDMTVREACVGVNCSLKRDAFLHAGGFDPNLRHLDEDMELGARLFLRGATFVFEPSAMVEHRDTKVLSEYHLRCWRLAAANDVYRITQRGERSDQVGALMRLRSANPVRRTKEQFAWTHPGRARRIAEHARDFAEATGLRFAARMWRSFVSSAEYWEEVRASGLNAQTLQQAIAFPVTTLAFHSIAKFMRGDDRRYCLTGDRFRRMLAWLDEHGFECIVPGSVAPHARCFELTFDDAYEELFTELTPHVSSRRLKPLVFVVAGEIGGTNSWDHKRARCQRLINLEQMREMQRAGVTFGSHTINHPDLTQLSDSDLRREVRESKSRLEHLLGCEVSTFAYPYGCVDQRVRAAVGEAGYTRAYTTYPGRNWFGDPLSLKRVEIGEADSLASFARKVKHGASRRDRIVQHLPQHAVKVLRMLL